jgi:hypothetical protein
MADPHARPTTDCGSQYNDKGETLYDPPGPTRQAATKGAGTTPSHLHERHLAANRSEEVQYATRGFAGTPGRGGPDDPQAGRGEDCIECRSELAVAIPDQELDAVRPYRLRGPGPTRNAARVGPAPPDRVSMPAQQTRGDDQRQLAEIASGQEPGQRGQDRPVGPAQPRSLHLAPEHGDLVTQDQAPGRDPGLGLAAGPADLVPGPGAAGRGRGAGLPADRQPAHRHHGSRGRHPGAAPGDGRAGPALRLQGEDLCSVRSGVQTVGFTLHLFGSVRVLCCLSWWRR